MKQLMLKITSPVSPCSSHRLDYFEEESDYNKHKGTNPERQSHYQRVLMLLSCCCSVLRLRATTPRGTNIATAFKLASASPAPLI